MFGGRRLIGTPNDQKVQRNRGLDFTPIGEDEGYERPVRAENNYSPLQSRNYGLNRSPVADLTMHESLFDNTSHSFDTIGSEEPRRDWNPNLNFLDDIGKHSGGRDDGGIDFVSGTNPLKRQQDNASKLQEENINLRVRLATLSKYLGDKPQDTRDLIDQNIELKQTMMQMNSKLDSLNSYIKELEDHSLETNKENQFNQQLQQQLQHNNSNWNLQLKNAEMVSQNYKSEVEDLKHDNEVLSSQTQKLQTMIDQLNQENDQLNREIDQLHQDIELKDEQHQNSEKHLVSDLQNELSDLQMQIREKDSMIDELEDAINQLKLENQDLEQNMRLLKQNLQSLSNHEQDLEHEISKLKGQIKNLQSSELKMIDENEALENQVSKLRHQIQQDESYITELRNHIEELQDRISKQHGDNDYIDSLEKERRKLYDQLSSSEDQVLKLERSLNDARLEIKSLLKLKDNKDDSLLRYKELSESLQRDIEQLKHGLRDQNRLINEIEELKSQLRKSPTPVTQSNPYLEQELKRLSRKNDELQHVVDSMTMSSESNLKDVVRENNKLKQILESREDDIERLSQKIHDLTRDSKMNMFNEDDEKLEMMKEIGKLKQKINLSNIEKDNLKEEYMMKLSIIRRQLQNESNSSIIGALEDKLEQTLRSKDEMLINLSNKQQELDELTLKNSKLGKENKELEKIMFALEENETRLDSENKKYLRDIQDLKSKCQRLMVKVKEQPENKDSLQMRLDDANQEIDLLTSKYVDLRRNLTEKIDKLETSKRQLKTKLMEISDRAPQLPTPVSSPRPKSNIEEIEVKLLRLKLHENQMKMKDLQNYNKILNTSITKTNQLIRENISKLDDQILDTSASDMFEKSRRKISFRVLAKFVLANVKLQNRLKEQALNKQYQSTLSKQLKWEKLDKF